MLTLNNIIELNKNKPNANYITLKYWISNNFGDAINPELFLFLTGQKCKCCDLSETPDTDIIIMCGSILDTSDKNTFIIGSGTMHEKIIINGFKKICCLRGPISRKNIIDNGYSDENIPSVFCDPGVFIPCMFNIKKDNKPMYKFGIIPHISDYFLVKNLMHADKNNIIKNLTSDNDTNILINLRNNPKDITSLISKCEYIVSSSLHGIVVAEALNIPAAWAVFTQTTERQKYKFYDYYEGCGIQQNDITLNNFMQNDINFSNIKFNKKGYHDILGFLNAFPFKICNNAFNSIKKYFYV